MTMKLDRMIELLEEAKERAISYGEDPREVDVVIMDKYLDISYYIEEIKHSEYENEVVINVE